VHCTALLCTAPPRLFCKELTAKETYNAPNYLGPREWADRCSKLRDTAIMVRRPAVRILDCIRGSDLSRPVNRWTGVE
jgi:hypothetical protein